MRRRCLTVAAVLVALVAPGFTGVAAAPGDPSPDVAPDEGRFLLNCTGAMATDGRTDPDRADPAAHVITVAMVDLDGGRVLGFGMGMTPISLVTADTIGFGSGAVSTLMPAAERPGRTVAADADPVVEGTIDRHNGATSVILRKPGAGGGVLIAMRLNCASEALTD